MAETVLQQDDISAEYLTRKDREELDAFKEFLEAPMAEQAPEEGVVAPEGAVVPPEPEPQPFDLMQEIPLQVVGGARDAVVNTMQALNEVGDFMRAQGIGPQAEVQIEIPEVPRGETAIGGLTRGASQIFTLMLPFMRGMRAAGVPAGIAGTVSGPPASFLAISPDDPRMSDYLAKLPAPFRNPVTEFLATDPDDTNAEARLKNALEDLGVGVALDGLVAAYKAVRGAKALTEAGVAKDLDEVIAQHREVTEEGVTLRQAVEVADEPSLLDIDPSLRSLYEDVVQLADEFQASVEIARRTEQRPPGGSRAAAHAQAQNLIDQGRWTLKDVRDILPGTALNDTQASLLLNTLNSAADVVQQSARAYIESGAVQGSREERSFLGAMALLMEIDPVRFGARTEAGRSLSILNEPLSSFNRFLDQFADVFRQAPDISSKRLAQMVASLQTPQQVAETVTAMGRPGAHEMMLELWINGLLSGPATQLVNFTSNILTAGWSVPERMLASSFQGGPAFGEGVQMMYGFWRGLADGWKLMSKSFKAGEPVSGISKMEIRPKAITAENLRVDPESMFGRGIDFWAEYIGLGSGGRLPTRVLMSVDEFFKGLNYRMEVHAQAYRLGKQRGLEGRELSQFIADQVRNPDASVKRIADDFALYNTFQSELGELGQRVQGLAERATIRLGAEGVQVPVGRVILPFIRTPSNIFKFARDRTLLGFFAREVQDDIVAGGQRAALAKARIALGTMAMTTMAGYVMSGSITGRGPADARLRRRLEAQGWSPYSVKIGNKYVRYNRLDPIGMLMGFTADFVEMMGETDTPVEERIAAGILLGVSRNFLSKTYMRSLSETMNALAGKSYDDTGTVLRPGVRFLRQFAGTVIPTSIATIERSMDPVLREVDSVMDAIRNRIPGLSETLPARRNIFGEPIMLGHGWSETTAGAIYNAVSPLMVSRTVESPVDKEIFENRIPLSMPARNALSVDDPQTGETIRISPREREAYIVLAAGNVDGARELGLELSDEYLDNLQTAVDAVTELYGAVIVRRGALSLKDALAGMIATPEYQAMSRGPDGGRSVAIRQLVNVYREVGKRELGIIFPEIGTRLERERGLRQIRRAPEAEQPALREELEELLEITR